MSRMRRVVTLASLAFLGSLLWASSAPAALLRPGAGRAYPDIAADINGTVIYSYNSSTQNGLFQVVNTPYLIAGGPTSAQEYAVNPTATGQRQQMLSVALDSSGNVVTSGTNSYSLYGTITAEGQTFTGLLLTGTPKAFGAQDLDPVGITGVDVFDVEVEITGGTLAQFFGTDAYIRITPELNSTFHGSFAQNFTASKATSNTRSYGAPQPFPVPEPTTLLVLALGSLGAIRYRRHMAGSR